jgi:hypothetical protein
MNQAVQQFFDMVQRYAILRKRHREQTSPKYFLLRYDTKVGLNLAVSFKNFNIAQMSMFL